MACFLSEAEKEARKRNRLIEGKLKGDKKELRQEIKLLLLGAGESGKSTVVKQMRIIHGGGYSQDDLNGFKPLIFENVHKNTTILLEAAEEWNYKLAPANEEHMDKVFGYDKSKIGMFQSEYLPSIALLFKDPAIQQALKRRNELQLNDSAEYYFDRLGAFQNPSYVPNVQDVLCSRVATTGISEFNFEMEGTNFRMLDVGGQRSERRKWIHCFEGITSITFIAAINGYDQVCFEDNATNRMFESLALWDQIVNYAIFEKVSMILFFNKMDLFEKKVHKSAIGEHFPAFLEYCSTTQFKDIPKPTQLDFGKGFFLALFKEKVAPDLQGGERDVYAHYTTATDTQGIKAVFDAVRSTIINNNAAAWNVI
eukprot:m.224545 g.224545  ORF g.224545 m.224545 type:complete len:368 (-) comp54198_c0_seq5:105-1208(-)